MIDGINRLETAPRTPQAAGARLFWACRYAGFFSRATAMASLSDRPAVVTGFVGVVGCWATATAAGPRRRPATINTCFMVVLEKICREVEAPYAPVTAAVSACDRNLVGGTRAARSAAGEALGDEVPGGYVDFHEAAAFIQPDIDRPLALDAQGDMPEPGGVPIQSSRSQSEVLDLDDFPPEAPWIDGGQRGRLRRRPPAREHVQREHRVVEYRRSGAGREFPRTLGGARNEPHREPSPAQLAEDARRLARIGDVVLQGCGHRIAVHFEDGGEHDDRPRAIVADRRGHCPAGVAAREPSVGQAERLARDLERVHAHDENALVHGRSDSGLQQCKREETRGHAATAPKTRVAMRSWIILYSRAPFSADARLGRPMEPGERAGTE